jgi:2-methylcitrate dehydratase PrpD
VSHTALTSIDEALGGDRPATTTQTLAQFVADATFDDLPPGIVAAAKLYILDSLGCQIGGAVMPHARVALGVVTPMSGTPEATVLATGHRTNRLFAGYLNAALANALDFDDCYLDIAHPAATIVPSAMATAERVGASGEDLLNAIVVGYEVSLRICDAIRPTRERHRIGPTMATWQIFGAAVAAAKLLGSDVRQVMWTFGHAGVSAPVPSRLKNGLYPEARPFSQIKNNFGWAAMGGILGAELANAGLPGNQTMFDTDENFAVMAGSDRCDHARFTAGLGTEYLMPITGLKRYGACRQTHSTLDAVTELIARHAIEPANVEHVLVESTAGIHRNFDVRRPASVVDAQFSIPPLVALTLAGHSPAHGIAMDRLDDPIVQELIGRVEVGHDPDADRIFAEERHIPATVTIRLRDGEVLRHMQRSPSGDPEHPLSPADVEAKFRELTGPVATPGRADRIVDFVQGLEDVPSVPDAIASWYRT